MLVAKTPSFALAVFLLDLQTGLDVPLKMPPEPALNLALHTSSLLKNDDSVGLDKCSDVQHRNQDTCPPGEDDGYEVWHE